MVMQRITKLVHEPPRRHPGATGGHVSLLRDTYVNCPRQHARNASLVLGRNFRVKLAIFRTRCWCGSKGRGTSTVENGHVTRYRTYARASPHVGTLECQVGISHSCAIRKLSLLGTLSLILERNYGIEVAFFRTYLWLVKGFIERNLRAQGVATIVLCDTRRW